MSEYNIKLTEQYIRAIESFQGQFLVTMTEEIKSLRAENKRLSSILSDIQEDMNRIRNAVSPMNIIDGIEEIEEELRHQNQLRKELVRRMRVLELEQAKKGINTPAEIETQILDMHSRITEVEARIKILSFDLEKLNSSTLVRPTTK